MGWTCAQNGQRLYTKESPIRGFKRGKMRGRPKKNWMIYLEEDWSKTWTIRGTPNLPIKSWFTMAKKHSECQKRISYPTP